MVCLGVRSRGEDKKVRIERNDSRVVVHDVLGIGFAVGEYVAVQVERGFHMCCISDQGGSMASLVIGDGIDRRERGLRVRCVEQNGRGGSDAKDCISFLELCADR